MDTVSKARLHPLIATAAVAIILVCMVGVAAITGLLPGSRSANPPPGSPEAAQMNNGDKAPVDDDRSTLARTAPLMAAASSPPPAQICESCGEVESIRAVKHAKKTSGVGMIGGAVVGGLLGNQIGSGNGRILGTVAGAAAGGYGGNEIEKRTQTTTSYEVVVRMENGKVREFPQSASNWRVGDRVRVVNGSLRSRG